MKKQSGRELASTAMAMLKKNKNQPQKVKTVDCTPDWVGLVPLFIDWIQNGNQQQYEEAQRSIMQMAQISDAYRKSLPMLKASSNMHEALKKVNIELCNIPHEDSKTMKVKMGIVKVVDEALSQMERGQK